MIAELRRILSKYRWLLLLLCGLGFALGLFMAHRQKPLYDAVGIIQIPGGPVGLDVLASENSHALTPSFITEAMSVKDDDTLVRVVSELRLDENRTFLNANVPKDPTALQAEQLNELALNRLRKELIVDIVRGTNLLRLSYESRDPNLAAAIINHTIDDFREERYKFRYRAANQATQFMRPRLDALTQEVQQQQTDLLRLQQQLDTPGYSTRHNQLNAELDHLIDSEVRARLTRIASKISLDLFRQGADDLPTFPAPAETAKSAQAPSAATDSTLLPALGGVSTTQLRLSLAEAQQQAALLLATLGSEHPQVIAVQARIAALQSSLAAERKSLLAAAISERNLSSLRERELTTEVEDREQHLADAAPLLMQYDNEQRSYLFSRALAFRFLWRLHIASIDKAYDSANVTVVEHASIRTSSSFRPRWQFLLQYTSFGFIVAILTILRLESHFGTTYQRMEELEEITGLKILAAIPKCDRLSLANLISPGQTSHDSSSRQEELQAAYLQSIFDLRALLQYSPSDRASGNIILFTSAVPSEGKTTVSSSVAAIMARQGQRVLIVDADLRRPSVQRFFRLPGRIGLSSILNGKSTFADAVQTVKGVPNLHVIGSGPIPPVALDLTDSPQMQHFLQDAAAAYNVVIIDSPPVLAVSDSLLLSHLVDKVVWVVKDLKVGKEGLSRTRSLLENAGAPVVGIAVNAMNLRPIKLSRQSQGWPRNLVALFRRA